jgi:hypothetical protein
VNDSSSRSKAWGRRLDIIAAGLCVAGFLLRLIQARSTYLNPDEASFFFLALPNSSEQLYLSTRIVHHPPMLVFLLHFVIGISSSETALRLIPVVAGSIFPWTVYRWLGKVASKWAGLGALIILTFSPNLIALSAQVRGYTLAFLFAGMAILFLENALEKNSVVYLACFTVSLCVAILSEYSIAWFAGAAGIYFLVRIYLAKVSRAMAITWALGQAAALFIYAFLYWTSLRVLLHSPSTQGSIDGFLRGAFPQQNQNIVLFGLLGTLKQFSYVFGSIWLGTLAALLFSVTILWSISPKGRDMRTLVILLISPFIFAFAGALMHILPYGRSRHTAILGFFVAAGVGIALEKLARSRPWIAVLAAGLLIPIWQVAAEPDQNNIEMKRHHMQSMISAVNYIQSSVPPGSLILTDLETSLLLRFYISGEKPVFLEQTKGCPSAINLGRFRVAWSRWDFENADNFMTDLNAVQNRCGLAGAQAIWVADGGFSIGIGHRLHQSYPDIQFHDIRNFEGALEIFPIPSVLLNYARLRNGVETGL